MPSASEIEHLILEFQRALLQRHDLSSPDGRALYEYRLTAEEFHKLKEVLRSFQPDQVLQCTRFSALFVLYASEWWRRRYDGSGFSWEPILRSLGVDPEIWTPTQRSQCVKEGLAAWCLPLRKHGGLRFLGTVAVQGGLPLRLLSEARGGIGRLLSRVLQLAEGGEVTRTEIEIKRWIESLQEWLPESYRQNIIYELLAQMILVALKLKQEAGLSSGDDAVAVLDRKIPGWKDRFPVTMESDHARMLIEQLVRDAANVRIRRVNSCLPVERMLEKRDEEQWSLISRVELPDTLKFSELIYLFGIEDESCLPRVAELRLIAGENSAPTTLRRLAGRDAYRIEPAEFSFLDDDARKEHLLQLSARDGRCWKVEAFRGESLNETLPWIFSGDSPYEFLKQGSGRVADSEVFVALSGEWAHGNNTDSPFQKKGTLSVEQRTLFHAHGVATLEGPDGTSFTLHTGQADVSGHQLAWQGNRLWLDFLQPQRAYRGMPKLCQLDEDGQRHPVRGRPACRVMGNPASTEALGPVTLEYPSHGIAQIRTRILLLPERASLEYGEVDASRGSVRFSSWGISTARVVEPLSLRQKCTTDGEITSLSVAVGGEHRTPEWMTVELLWPHTTSTARIRLPVPASGVRVFDVDEKELQSGHKIAVDDFAGVRIVLNRGSAPSEKRMLTIETVSSRLCRRFPLRILPGALSSDIALIDYDADIQHLLSLNASPDSEVILSISSSCKADMFTLKITRYAAMIDKEQGTDQLAIDAHKFDLDQLNGLQMLAARLEHPADEPIELKPVLSEGVHTGRWEFTPEKKEPGTWLIYPSTDTRISLRPVVWPIPNEGLTDYPSDDDLIKAIAIPRQHERENQIVKVIEAMADNFQHNAWQTVEQLVNQFGHLPLATLDLWRMFTRSSCGMAALILRLGNLPNNFYRRFERELPFAWETVSLRAWKQAMDRLQEQCGNYPDASNIIFKTQLEKCLSALRSDSGALSYLLGIAASAFDEKEKKDLDILRNPAAYDAKKELCDGENSKLMALRRNHADEEWPSGFEEILHQARNNTEVEKFLVSDPNEYRNGVINMPVVAAIAAVLDQSNEFFPTLESIHQLRTAKAFDMQWFDDAYNLTIARYLVEEVCNV